MQYQNLPNQSPLLSIVLPVYNVEKYIERCIRSLLKNSDPDVEIIFVDDCGSDKSIEIVENFAKVDSRIRVYKNSINLGTLASRANGALNSFGQYIFFLDPDDEISIDAIDIIRKEIDHSPDVIVTGVKKVPGARIFKNKYSVPNNADSPLILKSAFIDIKSPYWGTPGKVYRRYVLLKALGDINLTEDKLTYGEDLLLYILCLNYAKKMRGVLSEIYYYHENPTSITRSEDFEKLNSNLQQLNRVYNLLIKYLNEGKVSGPFAREAMEKACSMLKRDMAMLAIRMVSPLIGNSTYEFKMIGRYVVLGDLVCLLKAFMSWMTFGRVRR